jgi:cytochrome P450
MTMLIAGQDTTSTSLAWTVHHLCQNPAVLARMRAEMDAVLGDDLVPQSVEQAQRLTYTGAVVSESMRLTPVVPILYLETNEDTVIGDVSVPKGTPVLVLTRPSMREGQFADPTAFRPERWLDDERGEMAHDPTAHIPFGSGPRLCPGRPLATLETRVALATLFRSFDVERVGDKVAEAYTSIMVPSGLTVRLRARQPAARRASVAL